MIPIVDLTDVTLAIEDTYEVDEDNDCGDDDDDDDSDTWRKKRCWVISCTSSSLTSY